MCANQNSKKSNEQKALQIGKMFLENFEDTRKRLDRLERKLDKLISLLEENSTESIQEVENDILENMIKAGA